MTRTLRIEIADVLYDVTSLGYTKAGICLDHGDREQHLETLNEVWRIDEIKAFLLDSKIPKGHRVVNYAGHEFEVEDF